MKCLIASSVDCTLNASYSSSVLCGSGRPNSSFRIVSVLLLQCYSFLVTPVFLKSPEVSSKRNLRKFYFWHSSKARLPGKMVPFNLSALCTSAIILAHSIDDTPPASSLEGPVIIFANQLYLHFSQRLRWLHKTIKKSTVYCCNIQTLKLPKL